MKKILILMVTLVVSFASYSQEEHMKFMGVPINGTINSFQSKISAKGVSPDSQANATIPIGVRAFKGDFAGYDATIYVYYDKNTKIVYRAKACIEYTDEDIFERKYNNLKDLLETKYSSAYKDVGEQNGHETVSFFTLQGVVGIYTSKYTDYYPTSYTIHVDYEDRINSSKHEESQMDDL